MDHQFKVDFATVYGFNFQAAADDLGVSKQTILRWYDDKPTPIAKKLIAIMARGYLPDYPPFTDWSIKDTTIFTPQAKFDAFEVEFLYRYKWTARRLQEYFNNKDSNYSKMVESAEKIVEESENLMQELKRVRRA